MGKIIRVDVGDHRKLEGKLEELLRESWEQKLRADMSSWLLPTQQEVAAINSGITRLKRSLVSFDQLNRLVSRSSGSSAKTNATKQLEVTDEELENLEKQNLTVKEFYQQTRKVLETTLALKNTVNSNAGVMAGVLGISDRLRESVDEYGAATQRTNVYIEGFNATLELLRMIFQKTGAAADTTRQDVEGAFYGLDAWFQFQVAKPVKNASATLWEGLAPGAKTAWRDTKSVFSDAGTYFSNTFGNAWKKVQNAFSSGGPVYEGVTNGVLAGLKTMVNKLIKGINNTVSTPFSALNDLFKKLRAYIFDGKNPFAALSFSVAMPAIPLLASGAVLPANKPFMAVVGDQKHGTNVEAPLETIQQAVAQVMTDVVEADMAGHNATVQVLRQILEAVLGISLDEGTLARAVERHQSRMAVVTGGF